MEKAMSQTSTTEPVTSSGVLRAARARIEREEHWTQNAFARVRSDDVDGLTANDPRATCWCALGAIRSVADEEDDDCYGAARAARRFLERAIDRTMETSVSTFNDTSTHAEVLAAFDRAIAMAEEHSL